MTITSLGWLRFRSPLAWLALLSVAACNAIVTQFDVPATTWAGHEFVVTITGGSSGQNLSTGDQVGCVLQVPNAFTVTARGPGTPDEASLLQLYTAEPGHHLVAQSGFVNALNASTHFVVRAPANPGQFTFKVALGGYATTGSYRAVDPPGVTSFALITGANNTKSTTVTPATTDWFEVAGTALPAPLGRRPEFADLNHDGLMDVVSGPGPLVYFALPGGGWVNRSPAPVASTLDAVAIGDFDGDGHQDFVYATRDVFFGDGQGNWTRTTIQPPTFGTVQALASGDFDADGRTDLAECDSNGWTRCLRAEPGRTFRSLSFGLPAIGTAQTQLAFADLDGNGWPDLVGTGGLWLGNGLGTWQAVPNVWSSVVRFAIGDLIGDARPDVVTVSNYSNSYPAIYATANGTSWGSGQLNIPTGNGPAFSNVGIADLDADGIPELLTSIAGLAAWHVVNGLPVAVAGTGLPARLGSSGQTPAVAHLGFVDLDGDGRLEVVAGNAQTGGYGLLSWRNLTTGTYAYGAGCSGGSFAAPVLSATGLPLVGNLGFGLSVAGAAPQGLAALWLGLSRHTRFGTTPLPLSLGGLGAPGCALLAEDLIVHFLPANSAGAAILSLPIPADPGLRYVNLFAQSGVLAPGANALGVLLSQGLGIRID